MTKRFLLALLCLLPVRLFAQELKVGYFNKAEIFQSMPETQAAQKKIQDVTKQYESDLTKMKDEYQKKGSDFVAAKDSLPEAIRVRRMTELQDLDQRISTFYETSQNELRETYNQLRTPIETKLNAAIKAVGQEQNFFLLFDISVDPSVNALNYWSADKCVDVTNAIRTKLNLK
jgi:outer membrane protein